MRSFKWTLRRKLFRKLQALKFAVKQAQEAWQILAGKRDEEGLSLVDYHFVVGHCASLISSVIRVLFLLL
jgi:hypothetical protein